MYSRNALLVSTALFAIAIPGAAAAQDEAAATAVAGASQDPAAANTEADPEGSEVIVVTAQKRTQTLIEVPQSISVVSGSTLEEH